MQLKKNSIKNLQDYIDFKLKERNFDDETLHERLLLLTEEVGELINACRYVSGMNVDSKKKCQNEIGEEVADVINMAFAVGIGLGLDIEKEFLKKEGKNDKRVYKKAKSYK
jgi:NTP pyrophosphatase (non-canonical NTP hydrolase)